MHYDWCEEEDLQDRRQWEDQMDILEKNYKESLKEDEEIAYQKELEEWELLANDGLTDEEIEDSRERTQAIVDMFYNSDNYDNVGYPKHYNSYPGIEVIQLTEHMNFCRGNVVKYVARAEFKGEELEDLKKALWYLQREIKRIEEIDDGEVPELTAAELKQFKRVNPLPPSPWVYAGETNDRDD